MKPLSLLKIDYDSDEWRIQQTFEKDGKPRVVIAWGIDRRRAFANFEEEKRYLEEERDSLEPLKLKIKALWHMIRNMK